MVVFPFVSLRRCVLSVLPCRWISYSALQLLILIHIGTGTNGVSGFPLTLSETLTDHAVLQRAPAQAQVWGWGRAGAVVTLVQTNQTAKADGAGRWKIRLPPQPAGWAFGDGVITVSQGPEQQISLKDVLFGEVWFCTGQSNMGIPLAAVGSSASCGEKLVSWSGDITHGKQEVDDAYKYPLVRFVTQTYANPQSPSEHAGTVAGWQVVRASNTTLIEQFSGVCWMFGRRLFEHLGGTVPVGLIQNQVGASAVELWSSKEALTKCDQTRFDKMAVCKDPQEGVLRSKRELPWTMKSARDLFYVANTTKSSHEFSDMNATFYNGMIHPWINYVSRGIIWYQGEANVACSSVQPYFQGMNCAMSPENCADYYRCQFAAMVADWREKFLEAWGCARGRDTADRDRSRSERDSGSGSFPTPTFPFLAVGLPAYVQDLPSISYGGYNDTALPLVRLAQQAAAEDSQRISETRNLFVTSLIDHGYMQGCYGSIHPMDKTPVATRLLLLARAKAYDEDTPESPLFGGLGPAVDLRRGVRRCCRELESSTETCLEVPFLSETMPPEGLIFRQPDRLQGTGENETGQSCAAGARPVVGNPTTPVPPEQCGPSTGLELGVDFVDDDGFVQAVDNGQSFLRKKWIAAKRVELVAAKSEDATRERGEGGIRPRGAVRAWFDINSANLSALALSGLRKTKSNGGSAQLRYLFADWPTPSLYAGRSLLGEGRELPVAPFLIPVAAEVLLDGVDGTGKPKGVGKGNLSASDSECDGKNVSEMDAGDGESIFV